MPTSRAYSSYAASDDATGFSSVCRAIHIVSVCLSFLCVCVDMVRVMALIANLPIRDRCNDA